MPGVQQTMMARIAAGELREDPAQLAAAARLDRLLGDLKTWDRKGGLFRRAEDAPRGLYIWGGVGRGKSLLMDMFFHRAPLLEKRRVHFHEFMQDVHERIAAWRAMDMTERRRQSEYERRDGDDPIAPVARALSQEASLLCFDEFQVSDIADAMILARLFENLFAENVVVVATSNRVPDDLYKDGLNRPLFEPFIDMMKERLEIHAFGDGDDHRLGQLMAAPVYYTPLNKSSGAALQAAWTRLTGGAKVRSKDLKLKGRALHAPRTAAGCAWFSFDDLCNRPLGAADYLSLSRNFHTLFIAGVPVMSRENRNEAKRFVTLIDTLYEAKTKLVMSAAAEPQDLYTQGDGAFEFERTVSRLMEMRSEGYLAEGQKAADTA